MTDMRLLQFRFGLRDLPGGSPSVGRRQQATMLQSTCTTSWPCRERADEERRSAVVDCQVD